MTCVTCSVAVSKTPKVRYNEVLLYVVCACCDVVSHSETREKSNKTQRVVHYDANEIRKYMKKRREQLRQKCRKEMEAQRNAKFVREEKLQELRQRQQRAAAASAAVSRRKMAQLQQVITQRNFVADFLQATYDFTPTTVVLRL